MNLLGSHGQACSSVSNTQCCSRRHCRLKLLAALAIWKTEIGGGRSPRQFGQVRKEAAITSFASGRCSVSTFLAFILLELLP
jgi:hypothetical protein